MLIIKTLCCGCLIRHRQFRRLLVVLVISCLFVNPIECAKNKSLSPEKIIYTFTNKTPKNEPEYGYFGVYDMIGPNPRLTHPSPASTSYQLGNNIDGSYGNNQNSHYESPHTGQLSTVSQHSSTSYSASAAPGDANANSWNNFKGIPSKYLDKIQPAAPTTAEVNEDLKWRGIPGYRPASTPSTTVSTPNSGFTYDSGNVHLQPQQLQQQQPSSFLDVPTTSVGNYNPNSMVMRLIPKATVEEVPLPPMSEYNEPEVITKGDYVVRVEKVPLKDRFDAYYNPHIPGEKMPLASTKRKVSSGSNGRRTSSTNKRRQATEDSEKTEEDDENKNKSEEEAEENKDEKKADDEVSDETDKKEEDSSTESTTTEDNNGSSEVDDDDSSSGSTSTTTTTETPEVSTEKPEEKKPDASKTPMPYPPYFPFPPPPFPFFLPPPPYGFPFPPMLYPGMPYLPPPPPPLSSVYPHKSISSGHSDSHHHDRDQEFHHEQSNQKYPLKKPVFKPKFYGPVVTEVNMNSNVEKQISLNSKYPSYPQGNYGSNYNNNYPPSTKYSDDKYVDDKPNYYYREPKQYPKPYPKPAPYRPAEPMPYHSAKASPPQYYPQANKYPPPSSSYRGNEIPSYKRTDNNNGYGYDEDHYIDVNTNIAVPPTVPYKPAYSPKPVYQPPVKNYPSPKPIEQNSGFYNKIKESFKSLMPRLRYSSGDAYPPKLDSNYQALSNGGAKRSWNLGENERYATPPPMLVDCDSNRIGKCVVDRSHAYNSPMMGAGY